MILDTSSVDAIIRRYGPAARAEWERLAKLDRIVGGEHDKPQFESSAEARKYDKLWKASTINLVGQTVNAYRQRLAVDGYRASRLDEQAPSTPWRVWTRSGMDARQKRLYAFAFTHGYAYLYAAVTTEAPGAIVQPTSGRVVYCHYAEPDDDWPEFALQTSKTRDERGNTVDSWRIWDDEQIWTVPIDNLGDPVRSRVTVEPHGTGRVPFSRIESDWGATRAQGLAASLVAMNDMINRVTFVLNLIGEHSSSALRYMTGVTPPVDEVTGRPVEPQVGPNKMMVIPEAQGKMGQLDPSDPTGLTSYWQKLIEKFFSLAQMPPHYLVGQMANLSAEALVAAESTFAYALNDVTRSFGLGIDRGLRLASALAGDAEAAQDADARVFWQPVQVKSLAAEVDALGKMVKMLDVPAEGAWSRIPGITNTEIERWRQLRAQQLESDPLERLDRMQGLTGGDARGGDDGGDDE